MSLSHRFGHWAGLRALLLTPMAGLGHCWAQLAAISPQMALPAPEEPSTFLTPLSPWDPIATALRRQPAWHHGGPAGRWAGPGHGSPRTGALPHSRVQADLLEGHQLPRALVASLVHNAIGALPDLLHLLKHLLEGIHGAASALRWQQGRLALLSEVKKKQRRDPTPQNVQVFALPVCPLSCFQGLGPPLLLPQHRDLP